MTTTQSVHAYRRLGPPHFVVRGIFDGVSGGELENVARHDEPEFGRRLIDLTESGAWHRLKVNVECQIDPEELKASIGPTEDAVIVVRVLAVLSSRGSKLRRAVELKSESPGIHSCTVVVERDDVGGVFELACRVVRTKDAFAALPGVASFAGALLGETDQVLFVLDRNELPYSGPVRVSWIDFGAADEEDLKRHSTLPLLVRTDGAPTVLLNKGIPDFRTVLEGRAGSPREVALRNGLAGMVGSAVWRQLSFAALGSIVANDEEGPSVPADWKGTIARQLARHCYPDADRDESLKLLMTDRDDPAAFQVLVMRVGLFADGQAKTRAFLDSALRAVRKSEDTP